MAAMKIKLFGRELSCFGNEGQDQESGVAASPDGGGPEPQKNAVSAVACPRCRSLDTKFCYFNNYNVNQPRHFCRSCERYWTSGGALRNLPMGSGRRKSAKQYVPLVRSKATDLGPPHSPKSSHFDAVVPLPNHSPSTSTDVASLILSRESLQKASSNGCQDASEPSLEPINPSPSHARIGPCPYGYGLRGVGDGGGGHGTRPWNAPLWSSIDMDPFMDKHPGEKLQAAKMNNCISIPLEENMPNSTVSVGSGSNFSGSLVKYDETSIQALNANS